MNYTASQENKWRIWAVVICQTIVGLSGCGGSSSQPTPQPPAPDEARVVFADNGALDAQRQLIATTVEDTLDLAAMSLPVGQVKVTIREDAARTVPGYGLGGYALGPNDVEIVIDALFPDLELILEPRLAYVVAHELHHAVRLRDPGIYTTLFDAMIFEGMADHYAVGLLESELAPWSKAFSENDSLQYLQRAEPLYDSAFDFEAWFFGVGTDLPQWTGYTLGYRLLRDHFEQNPDQSAESEVNAPASNFRPPQTL